MTTDELVTKATKAARAMSRRRPHGDDRYEVTDMVQDGCLAELEGRSAWYGVVDGLRHWLGRNGRLEIFPINERTDAPYYYDPLQRLVAEEQWNDHLARLDKLNPKPRCAYMLYRHEGKTAKVTAQILGVHPQYVVSMVAEVDKRVDPR